MEIKRPLLLISNDDGYQAKGIRQLVEMVSDYGDIIVCAPEDARSGFSCAFSATTPLRLIRRETLTSHLLPLTSVQVWSCNGTPVDCVKMALAEICPRRPDMVIGGINHGDNASVNAHYSGTMGVTLEGCMKYIPSVAFSLCDHRDDADFEPLRPLIREITAKVLAEGLPKGVCLNVNFPLLGEGMDFRGVKVCRMAYGTWGNEVTKCHHPRGYDYWWMVGQYQNDEPDAEDTDRWALDHGYVAITPTQIDLTAHSALSLIDSWNLGNHKAQSSKLKVQSQ
ncbi:MAG: 5'/3'-nucleotidase SurE [Prevotella sp.]|nr:5'/3'-nucleotidase SurE [Prevotella sp.]